MGCDSKSDLQTDWRFDQGATKKAGQHEAEEFGQRFGNFKGVIGQYRDRAAKHPGPSTVQFCQSTKTESCRPFAIVDKRRHQS